MLVIGDAMADWLGYGLEDAYAEQPDMGVIRKHKTVSGLIKYQPRGEPADWAAAAKAILATTKPDAIVVMLGLTTASRSARRHREENRQEGREEGRARQAGGGQAGGCEAEAGRLDDAAKRDDKPADAELSPDDAATTTRRRSPRGTRGRGGLYDFATSAGWNSTPRRSKS